jgi:hypothetical protein
MLTKPMALYCPSPVSEMRPLPHILCSAAPLHPGEWSIAPKCTAVHEARSDDVSGIGKGQ